MKHGKVIHDASGSVLVGEINDHTGSFDDGWWLHVDGETHAFIGGPYRWFSEKTGWRVEYDPEPVPTGRNAMIEVVEGERLPKTYVWDGSMWNPVLPGDRLYAPEFDWRLEELRKNGVITIRVVFEGEDVCVCGERRDAAVHAVNHPSNRGRTTHPFRGKGE